MSAWHVLESLAPAVRAKRRDFDGVDIIADNVVNRFRIVDVGTFAEPIVGDLARPRADGLPVLVVYRRASADARAALRATGASYVGEDGRVLLQAPGLYVERDDRLRPAADPAELLPVNDAARGRNPFATRGSRVARWLLLHHAHEFAVSELANAVDLSPPAVSRVLQALEDRALVFPADADHDARRHHVVLRDARRLLNAWAPHWERRRLRQRRWDIGARDAEEALASLAEAARSMAEPRWMIGGLAGASHVARAVEPSDVLVWVDAEDLAPLAEALDPEPARMSRAMRGTLRVMVAPDPWVLMLRSPVGGRDEHSGLPVADSVQLWLDCVSEGERALEAAEAVAAAMSW